MRSSTVGAVRCVAVIAVLVLAGSAAAEETETRAAPEPATATAETDAHSTAPPAEKGDASQSPRPRLYVPPDRGAARSRIGAATRGASGLPQILALAPDHVGLTSSGAPILFFHLDATSSVEVAVVVADPSSGLSLVETVLAPPLAAGLHGVRLADHGVELPLDRTLHWFVALVPDRSDRSRDRVAGAAIRREKPSRELRRSLEGASASASASEKGRAYARHGYWYDAFAAFSDPASAALRDQLLEEVGLPEARSVTEP